MSERIEQLDVVAGSAAYDRKRAEIEVLLVARPPEMMRGWTFDIGPVAARTLALLLSEAAEEKEFEDARAEAGL